MSIQYPDSVYLTPGVGAPATWRNSYFGQIFAPVFNWSAGLRRSQGAEDYLNAIHSQNVEDAHTALDLQNSARRELGQSDFIPAASDAEISGQIPFNPEWAPFARNVLNDPPFGHPVMFQTRPYPGANIRPDVQWTYVGAPGGQIFEGSPQ